MPSPRECGEKLPEGRMRGFAALNKHQTDSWSTKVGDIMAGPLNPVLYEKPALAVHAREKPTGPEAISAGD